MIMDPELDLFSMITEEAQYEPVIDENIEEETPQSKENLFEDWVIKKHIELSPNDLTVIRILLKMGEPYDEESVMEKAENYAERQMEGKFNIYEDNPSDIDLFRERAKEQMRAIFYPFWEIFRDMQESLSDNRLHLLLGDNDSNAEYAAYLYNLHAPFHHKEPIPYKVLTQEFQQTYNY